MADPQIAVGGNRHYGLKVGDAVEYPRSNLPPLRGVVTKLWASDNNRVTVKFDGIDESESVVAEWCKKIARETVCPNCDGEKVSRLGEDGDRAIVGPCRICKGTGRVKAEEP